MSGDWVNDALCAQVGLEPWYPEKGVGYGRAKKTCDRCPVRQPCLDDAMEHEGDLAKEYRGGMWGGLTPPQRANLATTRRQEAAA